MALPRITEPVTLQGQHVRLEPLRPDHGPALAEAARDGELWKLWYTAIPTPEGVDAEIQRRLGLHAAHSMLPFAVLDASGTPVGMTTYMNIDNAHQRVEIGSTWYAARVQRSPLNTEAKRLLLAHAFEQLQCIAVEFRTHRFNHQSRRAIERAARAADAGVQLNANPSNRPLPRQLARYWK
jgi:RimJ/RimL family protein N-acetyltransferase